MKPIIISTILLIALFTISNQGNCTPSSKVTIRNLPLFTGNEVNSAPNSVPISPPQLNPPSTDDYIGEVDTVGFTWSDMQYLGTCGQMIFSDTSSEIHVSWIKMLSIGNSQTQLYGNGYIPGYGWVHGNEGVNVTGDFYKISSYSVDALRDVFFYAFTWEGEQFLGDTSASWFTAGPFMYPPPPIRLPFIDDQGTFAPNVAGDCDFSHYHLINYAHGYTGEHSVINRLFYCRENTPQFLVNFITTCSANIAGSRHSHRAAIVYSNPITTLAGDTNQCNNNLNLVISEDGVTWDFEHPINVTNFMLPDSSLLPDTMDANKDTLRVYTDASVIFDENDNVHVAFTTMGYYAFQGLVSVNNSQIWHWSEETGYYSLVADGWFDRNTPSVNSCGAWQRYVQRPYFVIDPMNNNLFIVYQRYDTADVAASGYPAGEIMVSRSTSGGTYWSVGTDVSNTHAPGGEAGGCWSERDISCNKTIINNSLYLSFVTDKDAGCVNYGEGSWTLNSVMCQRIPIDQIPTAPLMPVYPLHCDSTGMPPSLAVEIAGNEKVPSTFHLSQNYPNPFNSITMIDFDLNRTDHLTLKVFNILGQEVATLVNGNLTAGTYRVPIDASNLSSGIYFYKLTSSLQSEARKMVVLK
jgi:hypothetical protein